MPYIEEQPLFGRIDLDAPWDEGANLTIFPGTALKDIELEWSYHSPRRPADRSPRYETHYLAIVGEGTVWEEGEATKLEGVPDGAASTIVLIEAAGRGVRWCEPRDLTIDEAVDLLTGSDSMQWEDLGFFYSVTYRGDGLHPRHVAFADGSVAAIGLIEDRELARALLTRSGGEPIDLDKVLSLPHQPQREVVKVVPNWGNVVSTSLFIGLVVAPFLKRRRVAGVEGGSRSPR